MTQTTSECPDIFELRDARAGAHARECAACGDLDALVAAGDTLCELTDECAAIEPLVAVMAVAPLDAGDRTAVEAHLAACPRCFAVAAEVTMFASAAAVSPASSALEMSVPRATPRWRRAVPLAAASAVAIAACAVLLLMVRPWGGEETTRERRPAGKGDAEQTHSVPLPHPVEPDPVSLVVLIQGQERWMGNEMYSDDSDPDRMQGAFVGLAPALAVLAEMGPPGSQAAVLTYSTEVDVKWPMADVRTLARAVTDQRDFKDQIGRSLTAGIARAHTLLAQRDGRRVLVVIGDGEGQREDISEDLSLLIELLRADGIEVFTIQHHAVTTDSPVGQRNMSRLGYSGAYSATSRERFAQRAQRIVDLVEGTRRVAALGDPAPFTVPGRIVRLQEGVDETLITLNLGASDGLEVGWEGAITDGEAGAVMPRHPITIIEVHENEAIASSSMMLSWLEKHRWVRVWP